MKEKGRRATAAGRIEIIAREHQPLVRSHSSAEIQTRSGQTREYQHVAERNGQKDQRRRRSRWHIHYLRPDDSRRSPNDKHQRRKHGARYAQPSM